MLKNRKSWKKAKRSTLAFLLALCMALNSLPLTVFATEAGTESTAALESVEVTEESTAAAKDESEGTSDEASSEAQSGDENAAGTNSSETESDTTAPEETTEESAGTDEETTSEETDGTDEDATAEETGGADADTTTEETDDADEATEETTEGLTLSSTSATAETAEMPEVTLTETVNNTTVTVYAPEGAFAEGVTMSVEQLTGDDAETFLTAVAEQDFALDETYTVIDSVIYDITFYDTDGEEVQPETEVTVTISGLNLATENEDGLEADYALIYHMDDEGNIEWIADGTPGEDSYTFTASSFSAYGIVNVNVDYGVSLAAVASGNKGNAGHIDIGVDASASVTIGGTTYSNTVSISRDDFTSDAVTITAVQGSTTLTGSGSSNDWNRSGNDGNYTYSIKDSNVDFVYNLSDLTASTGDSGISQVRIGGCFPVGTKDNPVEYTLTLTKEVTLYAETGTTDEEGNTEYDESKSVTVTVTLTATFGYWDSDNDCPAITMSDQNKSNWSKGNFVSGSGLDFVLSVSSTVRPTVTVYKYVVDEDGNLLTEASGESFSYTITSSGTTESDSIIVGSSGVGMAVTDVADNTSYTVTENESSIPAAIGNYSYIENTVTYDYTNHTATITNVYGVSTTEVTVTKEWDDANYAGRPTSITVNLLADGEQATDSSGNDITAELSASNGWTYTFADLPVKDSSGNTIKYTVEEVSVNGYTSEITGDATDGYTITNTLDTGSLTLNKVVKADSKIDTSNLSFTFYVSGFADDITSVTDNEGNTWSVINGVATVTVTADSSVTLVNLPTGSYTVYETQTADSDGNYTVFDAANTYTWTVSGDNNETVEVTVGTTASATITNTITGEAVVTITKNWEDSSNYWNTRPENDGTTFAVTLTATGTNGEAYTYTTTATWLEGTSIWTLDLSGVEAYDTEGNMLTYTVTETEVEGYTLTEENITVTPASDSNVSLTNSLQTANVTVQKIVVDSDGNEVSSTENDDDFRFALYDKDGNSYGTATLTAGGSYTFESIPLGTYSLTEYLVGSHDHSYDTTVIVDGTTTEVTETFDSDAGVKYHTVTFTLDENDADKTIEVSVTNQEEEISVDLAALLNGEKTLESENDVTKTFTYTVKEVSIVEGVETEGATVATGTVTVSNGQTEDITWENINTNAFTYTEVGTYYYVIYENVETGTGTGGVVYDATRYTLTIEVTKDENGGGLIATASMTKNVQNDDGTRTTSDVTSDSGEASFVAASTKENFELSDSFTASFTNTYDVSETSIILRASKVLTGRTLSEGEFSIVIQQIDESGNAIGEAVTRSNDTAGQFGYEIVYDEAGTYIYKVSEVQGDLAGVTYDGHYYIVYVYVEDEGGVLTVTGTDVGYYDANNNAIIGTSFDFDNLTFTNTYTATGSGDLSTYKVMQGRDFNLGETFTFTITALDSAAPTLSDPNVDGMTFTDNGDGTYTVTVTVTQIIIDDEVEQNSTTGDYIFSQVLAGIVVDQDNVGTYVYRVTETEASDDNGMTLDTATYGHLITVTVTDNGDGTMSVVTESTNDTDWNGDGETDTASSVVVNTFDPGTMTIYGTKSWVDGNKSHDSGNEITLTLYYRYLILDNEENDLTEDTWSEWKQYTGTYTVTWGTLNTNDWHIADLPSYNEDGYEIQYSVLEAEVSGYTTTYDGESITDGIASSLVPDDNASNNRYTITNTIEQEYMTISGTKTWVEPTETTHNNAKELVLTVTRKSSKTGSEGEELNEAKVDLDKNIYGSFDSDGNPVDGTCIVVWTDEDSDGVAETYNIYWYYDVDTSEYVGLPLYDSEGYAYSYTVAESYAAEYADTYADYEIETDENQVSNTGVTFDFTNRAPDDDEKDPTKTETKIVDGETGDKTTAEAVSGLNEDGSVKDTDEDGDLSDETVTYNKVAVNDVITYTINYYNYTNDEATVIITDVLDSGVTFLSAPDGGTVAGESTATGTAEDGTVTTWKYGGTVTWTLTVEAFTAGTVTLTVRVNNNAKSISSGETVATVDNQATVNIAGNDYTTNIVTNPLEDDEEEDAGKAIIGVTYEDSNGDEQTRTATDENGNIIVNGGDQIHYIITRYNNTNETVTFVIVDTLDDGVDYAYSSSGSTYYADDTTVTVTLDGTDYEYNIPARSVVWIVTTNPYSYATVQMTVTVNSSAMETTQTYEAVLPGTYNDETIDDAGEYDDYTYGTGENTTPSVANQAVVYTVGNDVVSYTNIVENPLGEDDPEDPVKTELGYGSGTRDSSGNITYNEAAVGDEIIYLISYYNHYSVEVEITITDQLDSGVEFVYALDSKGNKLTADDVFDSDSDTLVKWPVFTAAGYERGTVILCVRVTEAAGTTVENQAVVQIGNDSAVSTNKVTNPVPEEEETDEPETTVSEVIEETIAAVTGDNAPIGLALFLAGMSEIFLIILIILQARKKKDEVI